MPKPQSTQLEHHSLNEKGRDIAVGDVHGCFSALERALDAVRFDSSVDRLFSVGDLVDRGPESDRVLDWLEQPWFHAVSGNHEFLTWRRALGDPFEDVDHRVHGGKWLDDCSYKQQARIGEQLAALPLALEIETPKGLVGMIHADYPYDDWGTIQAGRLSDADLECCLWSRARYETRYDSPVRGLRALVHGHTPMRKPLTLGNVYFIDTGGWSGRGHFTLLDLHTLKLAKAK